MAEHLYDQKRAIEDRLTDTDETVIVIATTILIEHLAGALIGIRADHRGALLQRLRESLPWKGGPLKPQHHDTAQLLAELLDVETQIAAR